MIVAGLDMAEHVIDFNDLTKTFSEHDVAQWKTEIESWEADASKPNPFAEIVDGMLTLMDIEGD